MAFMRSDAEPLTRRRFLHQLGVLGGSSLVFSTLTSWDLMAGSAGQRPQLTGRPANRRVLVLGAGLSGLVAAYELGKLGYDYQLLEARDRIGGLSWTVRQGSTHTEIGGEPQVCTFDAGEYSNVGPWRIPYSHHAVLNYCRELGVPMQVFLNESDNSYFYFERAAGALAGKRLRLREVKADLTGAINELLVKALDQHQLDAPLTAGDQKALTDYLIAQGYLDRQTSTYKAFANRGEGDPYQLTELLRGGFGNRLRSVPAVEGTTAAPMFQPIGGMDQIPAAFAKAIGPRRITLNAEIQAVRQGDGGVTVVYLDTKSGKKTEVAADYVVVALPMNIVAALDINLSPDLIQAVKEVTYSDSAKVALAMRRRFWEEDDQIFGGHLYSDLPLGEFSYPSHDYFTGKGVLLGLYSNGPIGDLIDRPVAARIEHVLTHASKVHRQIREEFESGYAVFWKKVKYSEGGYASVRGQALKKRLATTDNRIVLGSAATTLRSAADWQEGAISAGWQALTAVHERAMRG